MPVPEATDLAIEAIREALTQRAPHGAPLPEEQVTVLAGWAVTVVAALRAGGTLFTFGNGGSAADAEHLAAELVGRYHRDRRPLAAVALTTNTAALTAMAVTLRDKGELPTGRKVGGKAAFFIAAADVPATFCALTTPAADAACCAMLGAASFSPASGPMLKFG